MVDKVISANALTCDLIDKQFYPVIVRRAIENAPALDVVEVVHGKWIEIEREWDFYPYYYVDYTCSVCSSREQNKRNYCPECGAKMNGENEL